MTALTRVSVVIPVHDGERHLAAALESVTAQRFDSLETVVIDDGSSDRSAEIAADHGARVIRTGWAGVAAARNRGLAAARGELVAFLDADDLWTEGSLAIRVEHLDRHPELDFVYGRMQEFADRDRPPPPWLPPPRTDSAPGVLPAFVLRREACARAGRFDESFVTAEDLDWISRLGDAGCRGALLDHVVVLHRLHAESTMVRNAGTARDTVTQMVRRSIERKRRMTG